MAAIDPRARLKALATARGVSLTFQTADGPVHALKDVTLTIGKGDFVSFIGPSGCGKTTFLRAMAALEQPTAGRLSVNGMTPDEIKEVFLQSAIYCSVPAANVAFKIGKKVLAEYEDPR